MDYERKYNALVEKLQNARREKGGYAFKSVMDEIAPELRESEDERIRKALISLVRCNEKSGYSLLNNVSTDSMITWLEKQGEQKPVEQHHQLTNGIYLIYDDGHYSRFNGQNDKENVKYIGVVHEGHPFAVVPKIKGQYALVRDVAKCPHESTSLYVASEVDALNEWDCEEATAFIRGIGTDIPLKPGEYIPSLPMVVAVKYWLTEFNRVLAYCGYEPFPEDGVFFSSTQNSATNAWLVNFNSGYVTSYAKSNAYYVFAVTAFDI